MAEAEQDGSWQPTDDDQEDAWEEAPANSATELEQDGNQENNKKQIIILDKTGDLFLQISSPERQYVFVVDSKALSRASPVFEHWLSTTTDGFSDCSTCKRPRLRKHQLNSSIDSGCLIALDPKDPAYALEIVLRLIHLGPAANDTALSPNTLADVIFIADKYELLKFIRLQVEWWWAAVRRAMEGTEPTYIWDEAPALLVAVTYCAFMLGTPLAYEKGLRSLAWSASPTSPRMTFEPEETEEPEDFDPSDLTQYGLDRDFAIRLSDRAHNLRRFWLSHPARALDARIVFLKHSSRNMIRFRNSPFMKTHLCTASQDQHHCDRLALVALEKFLIQCPDLQIRPVNAGTDTRVCESVYGPWYDYCKEQAKSTFWASLQGQVSDPEDHAYCNAADVSSLEPWMCKEGMSEGLLQPGFQPVLPWAWELTHRREEFGGEKIFPDVGTDEPLCDLPEQKDDLPPRHLSVAVEGIEREVYEWESWETGDAGW